MNTIIEQSRKYDSLDTLQNDLALMNVRETIPFRLNQMELTTYGTVRISGMYPGNTEYQLSQIALEDAIRRGGLQPSVCQNFFKENSYTLDDAIVQAINAYYKASSYANSEIKLISRAGKGSERVALGIPSNKYVLCPHEKAVEQIQKSISPRFHLSRCNLHAEFLEVSFTDPLDKTKDHVGEVVEIGLSFLNSQGTRTCSLSCSAFSIRLVCTNGATANDNHFSVKSAHRKGLQIETFLEQSDVIFQRFQLMIKKLPLLGELPITENFLQKIKPDLIEAISTKETEQFFKSINRSDEKVSDVWNKITNMPHRISDPETKLKLEQLGFRILTMHLS